MEVDALIWPADYLHHHTRVLEYELIAYRRLEQMLIVVDPLLEIERRLNAGGETEVAVSYRKRFDKNRDRLFTFLDHDGVPWNNNNAEHAIKAFARLRNVIGSQSTPKGIREYLVLLSISETCKYKGVSFLDFLRYGGQDIDVFAGSPLLRLSAVGQNR